MQPYQSRILVVNDGSFRVDFNADNTDCRAAEIDLKLLQMKKLRLKLLKQKIAVKAIRTMPKIRQKKSSRVVTYISRVANMRLSTLQPTAKQVKNVIYRNLHNTSEVWARPVEMFAEKVDVDGRKTDRFTFIG